MKMGWHLQMQPCINVVRIPELGNSFVAACRLECENNIDVTHMYDI